MCEKTPPVNIFELTKLRMERMKRHIESSAELILLVFQGTVGEQSEI